MDSHVVLPGIWIAIGIAYGFTWNSVDCSGFTCELHVVLPGEFKSHLIPVQGLGTLFT